jgi:glycine/D-amino acid oxidase-like deaminating enzyme
VRAGTAAVAINAASGRLRRLRDRLTVSSSHIVLTEPVPDVIEQLGWTGGEAITDGRALLHYFRTTRDGRILLGWGGGRMEVGARTHGRAEVDPEVVEETRRGLLRIFPMLEGRRIEHAWGGPIDVSPTHLPAIVTLQGGRAWAAFGYTGNGVGPSHLAGRSLAALALGRTEAAARWAWIDPPPKVVPPEPLRAAGATVIRAALARKEAVEEAGGRPDPLTRGLAAVPSLLGLHIVR